MKHLRKVLGVLRANQLYINLKKCGFMNSSVFFMRYIVGVDGIKVDDI